MKIGLIILFGILVCRGVQGQHYDTLRVGLTTTLHLLFDSDIVSYDLGSGTQIENGQAVHDVLITKTGIRLKLAASVENFETTNLFVETTQGYYNFILCFAAMPKKLMYDFRDGKAMQLKEMAHTKTAVAHDPNKIDPVGRSDTILDSKKDIQALIDLIKNKKKGIPVNGIEVQKMKYYVNGIYTHKNRLFIRIHIYNAGAVQYTLGYEDFFIVQSGKKSMKLAPKQMENIKPLFIDGANLPIEKKTGIS